MGQKPQLTCHVQVPAHREPTPTNTQRHQQNHRARLSSKTPFQWNEDRRAQLRAELDAAYLHLYGLDRIDAEHVIDSFFVLCRNEERQYGEFRTRRLVLAAYDAITGGEFVSPLDPAPGLGQRHPDRRS